MTKLSEVSDETSTKLFPHFKCQTLQCDTSTLTLTLPLTLTLTLKLKVDLGGRSNMKSEGGGVFFIKK